MKTLTFRYKSYTYEIFDRPGGWMEAEALKDLQDRLVRVAAGRVGVRPNYGFFTDTAHLANKLVTICSRSGRDVCFNALVHLGDYEGRPVVHLGSVYSLEGRKGRMQMLYLWSSLFLLARHGFRPIYITSLTHTPCIFGAVQESYSRVYPRAGAPVAPEPFHLALRDRLIETYLREFPLAAPPAVDARFVLRGFRRLADGRLLFPDTPATVPKHRNPLFNAFCLERLDYANGDEILQVGVMRIADLCKNGRLFLKGGHFRPLNILRNVGAQVVRALVGPGLPAPPHPPRRSA